LVLIIYFAKKINQNEEIEMDLDCNLYARHRNRIICTGEGISATNHPGKEIRPTDRGYPMVKK
jgi:hypothetical protein